MVDGEMIVCPSGLEGMIRPLNVGDINELSEKQKKGKDGKDRLNSMLSGVWQKTTNPSIYPSEVTAEGDRILRWGDFLAGDRSFLIYEARRITFGDDFFFTVPCPSCKRRIEWSIKLSDIESTGLSEEGVEAFSDGLHGHVKIKLPICGQTVGVAILRCSVQHSVSKVSEQGSKATNEASLLCRLPYIEGASSPGERRKFIRGMHMLDMEFAKESWEKHDITVEDVARVECEGCGDVFDTGIPVNARFFSGASTKTKFKNESPD